MAMLKIYGRRNSSNVQLVMWAVNEIGLEYERLDYGIGHASPKSPEFLSKNPMGLVPVFEDGPVTIWESAAILRYLGSKHGSDTFYPKDPDIRAPLDSWAEWAKGTLGPAILQIFVHEIRTAPADRDPANLDHCTRALTPLATILNNRVADRDWIAGDTFTFADIACGHLLHRYHTLDWPRPDLPALSAYYDRLQTRPAYRDHAMVDYSALRGAYPKIN